MKKVYWIFAYLGFMTPTAAFISGFRYDAGAPEINYLYNVGLYAIFIFVHLAMARPWYKRLTTGKAEGHPGERRVYITGSILTWVALYALHRPVPGFSIVYPAWAASWAPFVGLCAVLICVFALFEMANFKMADGLLGIHDAEMSHSHGQETPLLDAGAYAQVRHPMYRAFVLIGFTSLLIHPHAGQLLWAVLFGSTFVAYIPFEESQLLAARGERYRTYMNQTRYRIFPGVW